MKSGVRPSVPVWVRNIQLRNGDGMDLVRSLGHSSFDRLLVIVGEDRRHGGEACNQEWMSECASERREYGGRYFNAQTLSGGQHIKEHTQFGHSGASYSASKGINDYKEVGHSCHSWGRMVVIIGATT